MTSLCIYLYPRLQNSGMISIRKWLYKPRRDDKSLYRIYLYHCLQDSGMISIRKWLYKPRRDDLSLYLSVSLLAGLRDDQYQEVALQAAQGWQVALRQILVRILHIFIFFFSKNSYCCDSVYRVEWRTFANKFSGTWEHKRIEKSLSVCYPCSFHFNVASCLCWLNIRLHLLYLVYTD